MHTKHNILQSHPQNVFLFPPKPKDCGKVYDEELLKYGYKVTSKEDGTSNAHVDNK